MEKQKDIDQKATALKARRINFIGTFIIIGFALAVFFHYINGAYYGLEYPHNTFLFAPNCRLGDFTGSWHECVGFNPYFTTAYWQHSNYFPFGNAITFLFTLIPVIPSAMIYVIFCVISMFYFCRTFVSIRNMGGNMRNLFALSFMTYPFLFLLDRGNFEYFVFFFLFFFIYFFYKKNYGISSVFLACATAMKGVPALLLFLFLPVKKYAEAVNTLIVAGLLTLFSLFLHQGGFMNNLNYILSGFDMRHSGQGAFIYGPIVQRSMSFFTLIKMIMIQYGLFNETNIAAVMEIYTISIILLTLLVIAYVIFIEKELWKKVAMLVFAMLLFPQISADYKLIHVFFPMFLFINSKKETRLDLFYLISFGLLMIPKDYYILEKIVSDAGHDISISVPLNILILTAMMLVIAYTGLREHFDQKKSAK